MLINSVPINTGPINGRITSAPTILLTIEKDIQEVIPVSGSLLDIEKNITTDADTTTLLSIEKYITNVAVNTFYTRNGWEPIVLIGNVKVPVDIITGGITVVKQEDDNHQAEINLLMPPNTYNLYNYQGKAVQISLRKNGKIYRLFTGKVDIPTINVLEEKLTLKCVADRRILIGALSAEEPYIGYYSTTVLGQGTNTYDRINARMGTIPESLDFDSYNTYSITNWTPKATADFTYGSGDVYRKDPQLTIESSGAIINRVNLKMEFGYQRHYNYACIFFWTHTYAPFSSSTGEGGICPFLYNRPTMPRRDTIEQAINSAGWPVLPQTLYFGSIFKAGHYTCDGFWYIWATAKTTTFNEDRKNADGTNATDAKGNKIVDVFTESVIDYSKVLTMSAQWVAATRFNQNVRESYTATVTAPTSVARYGLLESDSNVSYSGQDRSPGWENYDAYSDPPPGVAITSGAASYYFNGDQDRATFNNAFTCALHKAQTDILKSHRDTTIVFQRELTPEIELKHTVALNGKWIKGKGKASRISHVMCIGESSYGIAGEAYSEILLLQYRDNTSVANTALNPPAPVIDPAGAPGMDEVILGNHLGDDPEQAGSELWNGYIGNITKLVFTPGIGRNYITTQYPESFVVDTPAIPAAFRDDRVLNKSITYNVDIPSDNTTYETYG